MASKPLPIDDMTEPSEDFEVMYEINAPVIYRFMFWRTKDKMLAEDLTSNVFEKAWRSRTSFKGGSATAWLHRIAQNTLIDHWRKRQDITIEDPTAMETVSESKAHGEVLDQEFLASDLRQAMAKLSTDMRQVVELRFIEDCSVRQTAQKLGLSESNVRVIQYRALQKLKGYLQ